jgi:SAM-dependent methyltransferase
VTVSPDELKACCAAAYASPAAHWLLGDSFHPGGAALTARLVEALGVGPGDTVVDVGSGPGTSALQLARTTSCAVVGVDLSPESVGAAAAAAAEARLDGQVRFVVGDAEALPLEDNSMDGVLCECALCTFPDKRAAAREMARVLRPGARLALSDLIADPGRLPPELAGLQARVACIADARPLEEVAALLEDAGLELIDTERRDEALAGLVDRVEARLRSVGVEVGLVAAARRAVDAEVLGYGVVIASKP